jgi:hypothetical protein
LIAALWYTPSYALPNSFDICLMLWPNTGNCSTTRVMAINAKRNLKTPQEAIHSPNYHIPVVNCSHLKYR